MAKHTLGPLGQIVTWFTYILLFYSLLSAYIAGGSDLFRYVIGRMGLSLSPYIAATAFTIIFGVIVLFGIRSVDLVNRGLMTVKLLAYFSVVLMLIPFISSDYLLQANINQVVLLPALTVTITSFGFANIVPSLRIYFAGDISQLKKAIFWGSFLPLMCYLAWCAVVMGTLGDQDLSTIMQSNNATSSLAASLTDVAKSSVIQFAIRLFTSICVVTSFLGVALSLVDFLADGLRLEKRGGSTVLLHGLAFLPPYVLALLYPNIFIKALEHAGIYCVILLVLLPALMAWRGRYVRHLKGPFEVIGGKFTLIVLILFTVAMILSYLISY